MTVASVTTDIHIGPYIIPSNAQNMIMNNYAERNKISIELVIPEPMKSNSLATLLWIHEERRLTNVILCSIYQLPQNKIDFKKLVSKMNNIKFHFAIEGINGNGELFLNEIFEEVKYFLKAEKIDSKKSSWIELSDLVFKKTNF